MSSDIKDKDDAAGSKNNYINKTGTESSNEDRVKGGYHSNEWY